MNFHFSVVFMMIKMAGIPLFSEQTENESSIFKPVHTFAEFIHPKIKDVSTLTFSHMLLMTILSFILLLLFLPNYLLVVLHPFIFYLHGIEFYGLTYLKILGLVGRKA